MSSKIIVFVMVRRRQISIFQKATMDDATNQVQVQQISALHFDN